MKMTKMHVEASKHRNCSNSLLGKSGKTLRVKSSCCAVPAAPQDKSF